MPRKSSHVEADEKPAAVAGVPPAAGGGTDSDAQDAALDQQPPHHLNGKLNPAWARWAYRINTRLMMNVALGIADMPKGYNAAQVRDLLDSECRVNGMDPKYLADTRTDAQVFADATETMLKAPMESFAQVDAFLEEAEKQMNRADEYCAELVDGPGTPGNIDARLARQELGLAKKKWLERLGRLRRLRDRAKYATPSNGSDPSRPTTGIAQEHHKIAHILRYMIYVSPPDGSSHICYIIGRHHARMALALYSAEQGKMYDRDPRDKLPPMWKPYRAQGALLVCPPGHGKPLSVETPVLMGDGSIRRLGDIRVGDTVISHTGIPRAVTEVFRQGQLPCVKITTESGRTTISALDHPFLTTGGWKEAKDLSDRDTLALLPRAQTISMSLPRDESEFRLAGYFVGDGTCVGGQSIVTNADPEIIASVVGCAEKMGYTASVIPQKPSPTTKTIRVNGGCREWLRKVGLAGKTSHTKTVPEFVFAADNAGIAAFLAAYFECDGSINKKGKAREDCCIEFYSVSRTLLEQVRHLLLRLGVASKLRFKDSKLKGKSFPSWRLSLQSEHEVWKFMRVVPVIGPKMRKLIEWNPRPRKFSEEFIPDPVSSVEHCDPAECRCLTVEHDHTFLANDHVVHNTSVLLNRGALRISQNPRLRVIILHSKEDEASKNLIAVTRFFDPKELQGRRNLSLFPELRMIRNNTVEMRLYVAAKQRQATLSACGINAESSGADADEIWCDDICDQSIAEQEIERNRVFDRLNGTWRRRLRDGKSLQIMTTTLWHHDDPHCRIIQLTRVEKKIDFVLCVQECGGPDNNFKALFPELWPSSRLRAEYAAMRNPRLWAAQFQSNPQPEELRPIRRLAYYDPTTEQHRRFIESAIKYQSLDPAATANEKSDNASFVYAGIGDVVSETAAGVTLDRRLRILDAERIKAKQTDAVSAVCSYAVTHSTHYVMFEAVGGFAAVGEMFEMRGIDPIPMKPHNRSKGLRLKDVAIMLDDSLQDKGLSPAVVEFPGKVIDGKLGPDPDSPLAWLEKQILEYGVCSEDDGLDAVTQMCKYLGSDLGVGQGAVTRVLQKTAREETRLERALREIEQDADQTRTAHDEEGEWLARNRGET